MSANECAALVRELITRATQEPPGEHGEAADRHDDREDDRRFLPAGADAEEHAGIVRGPTLAACRRVKT